MQNLCIAYRDISNKHKLYASGTTGYLIDIDALISSVAEPYVDVAKLNNKELVLDLSSNKLEGVSISANFEAFTFVIVKPNSKQKYILDGTLTLVCSISSILERNMSK